MTDPLRVAVVGAGGWGRQHARIFAGRADCELVAIAARTSRSASARAEEFGTAAYTDLEAMLSETGPDLVAVCLPNEGHYEPTRLLIDAGADLLVEKPLVFDLAEADDLLRRAEDRGTFFAINFNHRYAEPVQRLHRAIGAGELGELVFLTWRFGGSANHGTSRHANLIETQCHGFDLLEQLGGPIVSVSAQFTDRTYGDYSTVALALRFESGAVGTMLGSYDSSYAYPDSQLIEVNGTTGRATVHDTVRRLTLSTAGDDVTRVWEAGYFDDEARSFHSPSTGTSTPCWPRSGPATHRRCTPAPAVARSSSGTPRSPRSSAAPTSTRASSDLGRKLRGMPYESAPDDLVLHGPRVLGYATARRIANRFGLDTDKTEELLLDYEAHGWVRHTTFAGRSGWSVTERGRAENERRLAAELDRAGGRAIAEAVHAQFVALNERFGKACTDWQLRPDRLDPMAANDHTDWAWDERVLRTLASAGTTFGGLAARLAAVLSRFDGYAARYTIALAKVDEGQRDFVDKPEFDSCHTVWIQFHEDLLATLGIRR